MARGNEPGNEVKVQIYCMQYKVEGVVCVCVCARARTCACVRACVCGGMRG